MARNAFKRELRYEAEREDRDCPVCAKPLAPTTRGHAKYCSDRCQQRGWYLWAKKRVTCTCQHCGRAFKARSVEQRFCGNSCHGKARYAAGLVKPPISPYLTPDRFDKMLD
jgi:endogenous inhibitor of DNA gyrase (YacG/DUF329 family)